jgi:hypothetical protein
MRDERPPQKAAKTLAITLSLLAPARMAWIVFTFFLAPALIHALWRQNGELLLVARLEGGKISG